MDETLGIVGGADRAPAAQSPIASQPAAPTIPASQYLLEVIGFKGAAQFEVLKDKIRAFLPAGSDLYEKSIRRGQVKLLVNVRMSQDDLLAHLNGITLDSRNSQKSVNAQLLKGEENQILLKVGQ